MKIGLALSGGGARGIAHLGVIKALEEFGIRPAIISAVSSGAVAGALYATGYNPEEILEIIVSASLIRLMRPAVRGAGLLRLERLESLFSQYLKENCFEKLAFPLVIGTTNINTGQTAYFSSGEIIKPLLASCCIPVMFEPVRIGESLYVDGGLLNNLPVEPLLGHCDYVIGVHTNPYNVNQPLSSVRAVLERSLLLAISNNIKERIPLCHLFIEPIQLSQFRVLDLSKAKAIFDVGYQHTLAMADQLTALKARE